MLDRHRSRDRPRRTGGRAPGGGHRPPRRRRSRTSSTTFGDRASPSRSTSPTRARSRAAVAAADDAFGGIDVLVNNAGYGYLSAVEEGDDAEVRELFDTNYFGVVDMIKAVLPGDARPGQSGHIVNISSMTGLVANPPNAYYSSTKFALEALTEALAKEVGPLGIKVTAIEPGAFRTDWATRSMQESATPIGDYAEDVGARKDADQGVRRPPARRPAQGRRGRADGDRRWTTRRCGCCSAATCSRRCATSSPRCPRRSTSGKPSPRTSTSRRSDDGQPRGQGRFHHRCRPRAWAARTRSSSPARAPTSSPSTSARTFESTDYPGATAEDLAETVGLVEAQGRRIMARAGRRP